MGCFTIERYCHLAIKSFAIAAKKSNFLVIAFTSVIII